MSWATWKLRLRVRTGSSSASDTETRSPQSDNIIKDCADCDEVRAVRGLCINAMVAFRRNPDTECAEIGFIKGIVKSENQIFVGVQFDCPIGNCAKINKKLMNYFNIPERNGLIATLNNFKDGKLQLFSDEEQVIVKEEFKVEDAKFDANNNVLESHITLKRLNCLEPNITHNKYGIQGKKNSCYIDTTLFSLFAFTNIFDYMLQPSVKNKNDESISREVQKIIKNDIVNPLRKDLFCSAQGITKLRQAMRKLSPKLEQSYMDVEEFLFLLFDNVLHLDNFVHFKESSDYMHQIFLENGRTQELPKFTTTQILVEMSFSIWDILLRKVPHPAYIIAMPRSNGQLKYCDRILPCRYLEISTLMDKGSRICCLCGSHAHFKCKNCFGGVADAPGVKSTYFCCCCKVTFHNDKTKRVNHSIDRLDGINSSFVEEKLSLLSVVCIKSNHYVCYVRCEEPEGVEWIFFDSDPSTGNPKMEILGGFEKEIAALEISQNLTLNDWEKMHPKMKSMLTDIYICIYVKVEEKEDDDL